MQTKVLKVEKAIDIQQLIQSIEKIGMSVEVSRQQVGQMTCLLIEKYFMRNSSVACCSVSMYSHTPFDHDFIVMSGGSAEGAFLKFSWGADEEFITDVCKVIQSL